MVTSGGICFGFGFDCFLAVCLLVCGFVLSGTGLVFIELVFGCDFVL